jgi:hypothetical protein
VLYTENNSLNNTFTGHFHIYRTEIMRKFFTQYKSRLRKNIERESTLDPGAEALSKRLWPWHENKLLFLVISLVVLDFCSTFAFLELSGNTNLYEHSPIARWALEHGGFSRLLMIDLIAVCILMFFAGSARMLYIRNGYKGFGRSAFVVILIPYVVVTLAAVFNNVALTFVQ